MRQLTAATALLVAAAAAQTKPDQVVARYGQELALIELTLAAGREHPPRDFAIRNVRLVDVARARIVPGVTILVRGGRIAAAGPDVPVLAGVRVLEGRGAFAMPGLADMHVHQLTSASHHLLHLINGVTTVRDMSGFPWMLEWRKQAETDAMLFPRMLVAGHILNAMPMDFYATVVRSRAQAQEAVQAQKRLGYDFIKVHNVVPKALYEAIAAEARAVQLDLVGHIPHGIKVAEAVATGQRTFEHLKGYLDDRTLEITGEDWVSATRGADVWNVPTLFANRQYARGDAARKILEGEEGAFASDWDRAEWRATLEQPVRAVHAAQLGKQREIIRRLLPAHDGFVAGTDSGGGYPFMVSGFALHAELDLLKDAGLSPWQLLRAATWNAARAARREGLFGEIREGASADVVLTAASPLENHAALRTPEAVLVRGRWLDREALARIRSDLKAIFARRPVETPEAVTAKAEQVRRRGYVLPSHQVDELAGALDRLGRPDLAARIRALRYAPPG